MSVILIYGTDGVGKSVQALSIAKNVENSQIWSTYAKNRNLYKSSGVDFTEIVKFDAGANVDPYKTMDSFKASIDSLIKKNVCKCLVIDEITQLRSFAQPIVVEEFNRARRGTDKKMISRISGDNIAGWQRVNEIVYKELERLAIWAEINEAVVVLITSVKDVRTSYADKEGELHSITTGEQVVDAKENVRKLADVRIRLERDGKHGKGYWGIFEKTQEWMTEGKEFVRLEKDTIMYELAVRGVIR